MITIIRARRFQVLPEIRTGTADPIPVPVSKVEKKRSDFGSEKLKYFGYGSVFGSKKCGTAGLYPSAKF